MHRDVSPRAAGACSRLCCRWQVAYAVTPFPVPGGRCSRCSHVRSGSGRGTFGLAFFQLVAADREKPLCLCSDTTWGGGSHVPRLQDIRSHLNKTRRLVTTLLTSAARLRECAVEKCLLSVDGFLS